MTNGEICTAVNALFRAVCDLKLQNNKNTLKSQMQFFRDFHYNRRAIINSFVLYEYYSNNIPNIAKDEIDLMREFLLTYLGKYDDSNLNDVFITVSPKSIKFAFASFERASCTNNTNNIINEIENDIARLYENSIFKMIDQITASLPVDPMISKIKSVQLNFKTGNLISKYNENIIGNYSELEKYIFNTSTSPILPMIPFDCNAPYEPYSPYSPYEPSECLPLNLYKKKVENINNSNIDDKTISSINESNIKAAISRILEITTTDELTQV